MLHDAHIWKICFDPALLFLLTLEVLLGLLFALFDVVVQADKLIDLRIVLEREC